MPSYYHDPDLDPSIPEIDFQITSAPVQAQSRKMTMTWSQTAADDLRNLWGAKRYPRRPDNALDVLKDALEDPNYDPDSETPYKGLWRYEDGRIATPEEVRAAHPEMSLVESMANEMSAEIDREIMAELSAANKKANAAIDSGIMFHPDIVGPATPPLKIPVEIRNAIELTPVPRDMKDAALKVLEEGMRRLENLP